MVGKCLCKGRLLTDIPSSETTANTLAATLALLGLYEDVQERVYQSIKDTLGDRLPVST